MCMCGFYFSFPTRLFDDRFPEVTLALRGDHFRHCRTLPLLYSAIRVVGEPLLASSSKARHA